WSPEHGKHSVIAAPVIVAGSVLGALTASRADSEPFPAGAEIRLRSFADVAGQSIANERAQAELRASRARIVRTADETRRRLERNLHDGAQQRWSRSRFHCDSSPPPVLLAREGAQTARRRDRRARRGARGTARDRARAPSGDAHEIRPRPGPRHAREPRAAAGRR